MKLWFNRAAGLVALSLVSTCVLAAVLAGAEAQAQDRSNRQQLELKKQELQRLERRKTELRSDQSRMQGEIAAITADLQATGADVQRSEARLNEIEEKLEKLSVDERAVRGKLQKNNKLISGLFGRMMLMGRNPPPVIITQPKDVLKMIRSAKLLGYHEPRIKGEIEELTRDLTELSRIIDDTRNERASELAEKKLKNEKSLRLAKLQEDKKQTLLSTGQELVEIERTAKAIAKTVAGLNDLIEAQDKAVSSKTNLGSYNQKLRQKALEAENQARKPLPPANRPEEGQPEQRERRVAALPPSAIQLTPDGPGRVANPGRLEPAIPFHLAQARLPLPAIGKKVIDFGESTAQGGRSKGVVIKTRLGGLVTSPCDGWVVYAGAFRSYGQLLIINAGGGYHVLLANLSRLDVQLGQFILAAEPVGSMAGGSGSKGKSSDPVLYVEFRKDGKPVDPGPWWASSQQRVQG